MNKGFLKILLFLFIVCCVITCIEYVNERALKRNMALLLRNGYGEKEITKMNREEMINTLRFLKDKERRIKLINKVKEEKYEK